MRGLRHAGSTVIGIIIGGIAFSSLPALAQMAVIDVSSIAQQIQSLAKKLYSGRAQCDEHCAEHHQ